MKSKIYLLTTVLLLSILPESLIAQDLYKPSQRLWKPQQDDIYLQEIAKKIDTEKPVQSIAVFNGKCFIALDEKIWLLENDNLIIEKYAPVGVKRIISANADLWALAKDGIYRLKNNNWQRIDNQEYVDICVHQGILHGATKGEIFRLENDKFVSIKPAGGYNTSDFTMLMEDGSQIHAEPVRIGPITRIESYSGTLHILQPGKLILFDGKVVNKDFIEWGTLPSKNTNDILSFGNRMYISTDKGLAVLRGAALSTLKGIDGLPVENTTCLEKGFDDDIWIGTTKGAVRMLKNDWHYFGADQWLPGDHVNDIAVSDNAVYIATDKGVGIIRYEPYTLLKKASFYERHIEEWGHKRLGFIHKLYKKDGEWVREVSDNDGGHTATYLAAMCYKYAVTGDKAVRKEAVESFNAMIWLERITPIDGFFARSIWSTTADKDEMGRQGSGGLPAKWYPTKDGKWFWKGDTSSDEVDAHFYAVSLFYDLVAEGKEKDMAKEHLKRIATYIMDNGWVLNDMDGKPTRWGRWNPEYLLRSYGYAGRGLNGMEALMYMQTALSITGDDKFKAGYQQLIDWGYQQNTLRQKNVFPPEIVMPWDDNLAFETYNTLFRYTADPNFRSIYLRSLERTWEVKRMEHSPWFNFSYGAITGNDCELEQSVKYLRECKLDCAEYNFQNSLRDDLYLESGYYSYEGKIRVFSPRESSSPTVLDGGGNGNVVKEPTAFLRDFWMGRYYGFIQPPTTNNPELNSVNKRTGQRFGAEPYNGPPRPSF